MRLRMICSWMCGLLLVAGLVVGTGCDRGVGVAGNNNNNINNDNGNGNNGDGGTDPYCGNGALDPGEDCDGVNLGGASCAGLGLGGGTLGCTSSCAFDTSSCDVVPTCGNSFIDIGEECDGAELGGQTCEGLGYGQGTLACATTCLFEVSGCAPSICQPYSASNPEGRPALQTFSHASVNLQIAVPAGAAVQDAGPSDAGANEAAVTFDTDTVDHEMAGFVMARSGAGTDARVEVNAIINALAVAGFGSLRVRAPGVNVTSHDGHDTVANTVIVFTSGFPQDIAQVRNTVVANLLGRATTLFTFPAFIGHSGSEFVLSFATQVRGGMSVIMGAVALVSDYDVGGYVGIQVADAANGTGLAETTAATTGECQTESLSELPRADIIWVLDDSGSMWDERSNIANNAANFYNFAGTYSLDFRMGVVNMDPDNNGILCTADGQSNDYFLTPANLTEFQACVLEPWGSLSSVTTEHGVTQAYNAVLNHLPRANAPNRIRPDAQLAVIYVSDEAAQEVKDDCGAGPWSAACVAGVIAPTLNLLQGSSDPEGVGTAHAITQPAPLGCSSGFSEPGTGYLELVQGTGGQVHSICEADLGPAMLRILEEIIAGATPVVLAQEPISASLAVAKENKSTTPSTMDRLERSRTFGFDYRVGPNGLVFIGQDFTQLPYHLIISYDRWQ